MIAFGGIEVLSSAGWLSTKMLATRTTEARVGRAPSSARNAATVAAVVGSCSRPAARRAPAQNRIVAAMALLPR